MWFFASVVLVLLVTHAGFRRFALWAGGIGGGLFLLGLVLNLLDHVDAHAFDGLAALRPVIAIVLAVGTLVLMVRSHADDPAKKWKAPEPREHKE